MSRTKVHTRYEDDMFQDLPSVTKVLGVINKPALMHWAWQMGCEGKDYKKVSGDLADVGTVTHALILAHLKGKPFDTREYSKDVIDRAETCFLKYLEWEKHNPFELVQAEVPMTSTEYQYGGTPDAAVEMNGKVVLIDFKSGRGIYEEMFYQLAAYDHLLWEKAIICDQWMILRIGRDEKEGFEVKSFDDISLYWEVFESCLNLYHAIAKAKGR